MDINEMTVEEIAVHLKSRYPALIMGIHVPTDNDDFNLVTFVHGNLATCSGLTNFLNMHILNRLQSNYEEK